MGTKYQVVCRWNEYEFDGVDYSVEKYNGIKGGIYVGDGVHVRYTDKMGTKQECQDWIFHKESSMYEY